VDGNEGAASIAGQQWMELQVLQVLLDSSGWNCRCSKYCWTAVDGTAGVARIAGQQWMELQVLQVLFKLRCLFTYLTS
jgi:hypothetical protein